MRSSHQVISEQINLHSGYPLDTHQIRRFPLNRSPCCKPKYLMSTLYLPRLTSYGYVLSYSHELKQINVNVIVSSSDNPFGVPCDFSQKIMMFETNRLLYGARRASGSRRMFGCSQGFTKSSTISVFLSKEVD